MHFDLTPQQTEIRDLARQFTAQEITPHAMIWDEQHIFPQDLFKKMADLGLMGMTTPETFGGIMLSRLDCALVYEQLAQGDMATTSGLSVHNMVASTISHSGSAEQQQRWLPPLAAGNLLAAFSLSEAGSGSDAASLQCQATRQGNDYILNGNKMWVTNGGEADLYLVMARTTPGRDSAGITCFLIEKNTPGFTFGKTERKMGLHSSPTRELLFTNCSIPSTQCLGPIDQGFKIALASLNGGRINIGAIAVGVAQAAFDVACTYARQREQFNQPIGAFQGIQFLLADMAMQIEAARLLVYEAAYKLDTATSSQQKSTLNMYASMAKCFATDMAMKVTTDAVQILGAAGYVRDYPVERYMRDIKVAQIFEGTNQIQRIVIARSLLGDLHIAT